MRALHHAYLTVGRSGAGCSLVGDEQDKDILSLTKADVRQYLALLRRRRYPPNTARKRLTSLRHFIPSMVKSEGHGTKPRCALTAVTKGEAE